MKNKRRPYLGLFGKLYLSIALTCIVLVWTVALLSDYTERRLSIIAKEHREILIGYAEEAEQLVVQKDWAGLKQWADGVRESEHIWLAILKLQAHWLEGQPGAGRRGEFHAGRNIYGPIHLYHSHNPNMELPLGDTGYVLAIELPQRMRPGSYWQALNTLITLGLPVLLVAVLSYLIYRHIISPLRVLQETTQRFSEGHYDARTQLALSKRRDEMADLATSFDHMAERIERLVNSQRQLIQDISHELRTPITRIKLALEGDDQALALQRTRQEIDAMQELVEDTMTLSWIENEDPKLTQERLDLSLLLEAIVDDARFEFPTRTVELSIPESCVLENSSQRALGQALENIIRNALKYTPEQSSVSVEVTVQSHEVRVDVSDQGPGVSDELLSDIFKPFFRVENARGRDSGGYGLGLALAKRQIQAVGGSLEAANLKPHGLCLTTRLPR